MRNIAGYGQFDFFGFQLRPYKIACFPYASLQIHTGRLEADFSAFDTAHIQHVVYDFQKLPACHSDLVDIPGFFLICNAVMIRQRGISDDGVQWCADVMGHIGHEKGFRFTGFFSGKQPCLQLLVLLYPVKCAANEKKHDKYENAAAKKYARHNEIRLSEDPDNQIPYEKQDQQQNRKIKQPLHLIPVSVFPDISGEAHVTVYVVSHQRASGKYHQIKENVFHNISCFTSDV